MSQRIINVGTVSGANDGDELRVAFDKINQNFSEIYSTLDGISSPVLSVAGRTGNIVLTINDVIGASLGNATVVTASYNDLTDKPTLFSGSYTDLTNKPILANVATSGSYTDLTNTPTIPSLTGYATETYVATQIGNLIAGAPAALDTLKELADALGADANFSSTISIALGNRLRVDTNNQRLTATQRANAATNLGLANVATSGSYTELANKPTLFSGSYTDLTSKPVLASVATSGSYADLTSKPVLANVATSGSYTDLSNQPTLFGGSYSELSGKPILANVATSGSYTDLTNKPTLFGGSYTDLTSKPVLANVATSGSYTDLVNTPTLFSGNYADLTSKPVLANVATSGSYTDLVNTPTITISGDATGSGAAAITLTLANTTVTAGTYKSVTVDAKGRVTAGTNPTTLSGFGITNAYTKTEVDSLVTGLDMKQSVRVATTAAITPSGTQTIDGVAVVAGDRVLVKDQVTASQNGIYVAASSAWSRAADADNIPGSEVTSGMYTFVQEGTVNADSGWVLVTEDTIVLGTTALTFTQFNGLGQVTAGAGLTKTGNQMDVVGTADRVTVNADSVDIASTYVGQASITTLGNVTTGTWSAGTVGVAYGGTGTTTSTGSGSVVLSTSPTLATPNLGTPSTITLTNATGLPVSTGISGLGAGVATFLATPSSVNLASAVTDETGSGSLVFATNPTLVTPVLGVASATSVNKVTITAPATGSTLTIADGKTLTASNTLTFTGTDTSSVAFGTGGTVAYTGNNLSAFAATTSAQLAGVISDETGSGSLVFATSPTLTTPAITGGTINNAIIGGTTRAAGNFTTLDANGNVILGDTSTDTVTVNGYVSIGGTPISSQGLRVIPAALTGTTQFGSVLSITATSAATAGVEAARVQAGTAVAAFTTAYAAGLWVRDALLGAGSTITNNYGVYVDDKAVGTNNYGVISAVSSGTNKYNLYASGTADNYFAGNVGVGTTTPTARLHALAISAGASLPLLILNNSSAIDGTGVSIDLSSDSSAVVTGRIAGVRDSAGVHSLRFSTFGGGSLSERVRIDTNGNLLIGATAAINSSKLLVAGVTGSNAAVIQGSAAASGALAFYNNAATTNRFLIGQGYVTGSDNIAFIQNDANAALVFGTNALERVRIDSAGNVGVGITTPGCKLEVVATSVASIPAAGAASSHVEIGVGTYGTSIGTLGSGRGYIQQQRTDGTATTYDLLLQPNGSALGVGTTSPLSAARLHVEQNANANYSTTFTPGTTPSQLVLRDISDVATYTNPFAAVQFGAGNTGSGWSYIAGARESAGASFLAFGTGTSGNSAERMRITSVGNLLIGGVNPIGSSRVELLGINDATSQISLYRSDLTQRVLIGAQYIGSFTNNSFDFYTNSTQKMRLAASGQLLLGTSTGSAIAQNYIDVNGTANCAVVLKAMDVVQGYVYADDASDEFRLAATGASNVNALTFFTGGLERARITNAGNVGIGTTAPSYKLDVTGNARITTDVTVGSLTVDSVTTIDTATLTTSANTAKQVIDTFAAATYRTAKYLIQVTSGTSYQSAELIVLHDGTTPTVVQYADIATGAVLATFAADISTGNVRLLTTPTNAVTTYKVVRTVIVV